MRGVWSFSCASWSTLYTVVEMSLLWLICGTQLLQRRVSEPAERWLPKKRSFCKYIVHVMHVLHVDIYVFVAACTVIYYRWWFVRFLILVCVFGDYALRNMALRGSDNLIGLECWKLRWSIRGGGSWYGALLCDNIGVRGPARVYSVWSGVNWSVGTACSWLDSKLLVSHVGGSQAYRSKLHWNALFARIAGWWEWLWGCATGSSPIGVRHASGDDSWDVCVPWSRRSRCDKFLAGKVAWLYEWSNLGGLSGSRASKYDLLDFSLNVSPFVVLPWGMGGA